MLHAVPQKRLNMTFNRDVGHRSPKDVKITLYQVKLEFIFDKLKGVCRLRSH